MFPEDELTPWQRSAIDLLLETRRVSMASGARIIRELESQPPMNGDDPRDQWKHHIRNNTPHE
jgi:hypothetical protein